jgi:methylglyoxal synthase
MKKCIALVAHDNCKSDLIGWVSYNWHTLAKHKLVCTGTTGQLVEKTLREKSAQSLDLHKLKSGPLGGDQQLGAMISEGEVDVVIFLWDPISVQPHDVDVKALLRIAVLYNVPTACNRSTADFVISSTLLEKPYTPKDNKEHIQTYLKRELPL